MSLFASSLIHGGYTTFIGFREKLTFAAAEVAVMGLYAAVDAVKNNPINAYRASRNTSRFDFFVSGSLYLLGLT